MLERVFGEVTGRVLGKLIKRVLGRVLRMLLEGGGGTGLGLTQRTQH